MKILVLDLYRPSYSRISKDTCGAYGTENNFGKGLIPLILSGIAKHAIFWPPTYALNLISEFLKYGINCNYTNAIKDIDDTVDFIFVTTSIVCCDYELNSVKKLRKSFPSLRIFVMGPFAKIMLQAYRKLNVCVILGEPEFISQDINLTKINLKILYEQ